MGKFQWVRARRGSCARVVMCVLSNMLVWAACMGESADTAIAPGDEDNFSEEDRALGLHVPESTDSIIPNRFIVVPAQELEMEALGTMDLGNGVGSDARDGVVDMLEGIFARIAKRSGVRLLESFTQMNMMVVEGDRDEMVALCTTEGTYCEPDHIVKLDDTSLEANAVQPNAPWGLDRIDGELDGNFEYSGSGNGVQVYVVDTGVNQNHTEFRGRIQRGISTLSGRVVLGDSEDCNGHGTHVAGTAAGTDFGVAKGATVVPVRVLGCNGSGPISGIIAAVDWIAANGSKPAVINMSLGGERSGLVDQAVRNAIATGFVTVVAAGNENTRAENSSPARVAEAITVGASDRNDRRATFSNFGPVLDLFAPGVSILSAYVGASDATARISGTSMASPHVAGVAAVYLESSPAALPPAVAEAMIEASEKGAISDTQGSPNRLLRTVIGEVPVPAPAPEPELEPTPAPAPEPELEPTPAPTPEEPAIEPPARRPWYCPWIPEAWKPVYQEECGF